MRDNFRNALVSQPELLEGTKLHTMVTVVDGSTFLEEFQKRNKLQDRPDLGTGDFVDSTRQVVDLMCEQIECADILILNKVCRQRYSRQSCPLPPCHTRVPCHVRPTSSVLPTRCSF